MYKDGDDGSAGFYRNDGDCGDRGDCGDGMPAGTAGTAGTVGTLLAGTVASWAA